MGRLLNSFNWRVGAALLALYLGASLAVRTGHLNFYLLQILLMVGINIALTVSLGMINGFTGQFSLGHAGFMAVGAYASVSLTTLLVGRMGIIVAELHPVAQQGLLLGSALVGGVAAGAAGFLVGVPTLRLSGDYLAIATMAFCELIRTGIRVSDGLGGPRGISGVPRLTGLGTVMLFSLVSVWGMRNLMYSSYGRAARAIRDNELAAHTMGINPVRIKVLVFVAGSFVAGMGGAFYAHVLQFIHPDNFTFMKSLDYLIFLYVGGAGSISGAILGASLFTAMPELLRVLGLGGWRMVIYPLILILVMLFRSEGLVAEGREFGWVVPRRLRRRS